MGGRWGGLMEMANLRAENGLKCGFKGKSCFFCKPMFRQGPL